jgi:hypothetical protein
MANVAPAFALAPALVNPGQLLDYGTAAGAKIYRAATRPLSDGDGYDLSSEELKTFLASFDDRIVESGWEEIFSIPEDIAANPLVLHMLTDDYGTITMPQIVAHVNSYIANNDRDCQNCFQAFNCLMNSVSSDAKKRLNLKRTQYTVNGVGNGPQLLKTIIQTAYVDTRSTVLHLREQLSQLDIYMVDVKSDVEQYNDYVKTLVAGLNARGEQTLDLLANLFKGYMAASDGSFIDFIKRKKDAYEEGEIDLTPEVLMQATDNKYNGLKQSGRWNQASEQDEKIIALEAQIKELVVVAKKSKKVPNGKPLPAKNNTPRPAWSDVAPAEGDPETKVVDGKTYYFCRHHGRWSVNPRHMTATCKGHGVPTGAAAGKELKDTTDGPAIRLQSALANAGTHDNDEDDDEE